jgi:hypothetical protein
MRDYAPGRLGARILREAVFMTVLYPIVLETEGMPALQNVSAWKAVSVSWGSYAVVGPPDDPVRVPRWN